MTRLLSIFYRPPREGDNINWGNVIHHSGKPIGVLDPGGYFPYIVTPGRHQFSLSYKTKPDFWTGPLTEEYLKELWLYIDAIGGQTYFIHGAIEVVLLTVGQATTHS